MIIKIKEESLSDKSKIYDLILILDKPIPLIATDEVKAFEAAEKLSNLITALSIEKVEVDKVMIKESKEVKNTIKTSDISESFNKNVKKSWD